MDFRDGLVSSLCVLCVLCVLCGSIAVALGLMAAQPELRSVSVCRTRAAIALVPWRAPYIPDSEVRMEFMWPSRPREPRERLESLVLATGLTALAAFAAASAHVGSLAPALTRTAAATRSPSEAVTYVRPHVPPVVIPPRSIPRTVPVPVGASAVAPDAADADAAVNAGANAADAAAQPEPIRDTSRIVTREGANKPAGPVIAPLGSTAPVGPRVMRLLPGGSTLGGWRLVGKDEQAGLVSEERKRFEEARLLEPADVAARGGAVSITTGWLGPGPTKEERRRDSAIHAGNMRRLAALAARMEARQDSIRRADSIARSGVLPRP